MTETVKAYAAQSATSPLAPFTFIANALNSSYKSSLNARKCGKSGINVV